MTARIIPDEQQNYASNIKKLADISYNQALYYECVLTFNFIVQDYSEKYVEQLKKLFTYAREAGANMSAIVNNIGDDECTVLGEAATYGGYWTMRALIDEGADANLTVGGRNALHNLCWGNNSASYEMNVNAMELLCRHTTTQSINMVVDTCNGKQTALDMVYEYEIEMRMNYGEKLLPLGLKIAKAKKDILVKYGGRRAREPLEVIRTPRREPRRETANFYLDEEDESEDSNENDFIRANITLVCTICYDTGADACPSCGDMACISCRWGCNNECQTCCEDEIENVCRCAIPCVSFDILTNEAFLEVRNMVADA